MASNKLSEVYKNVISDAKQVVKEELDKVMKDEFKTQAEKIYDVYDPINPHTSRHRDGIDGSYADEENIVSENKELENGIEYKVYDVRKTDCDCAYCTSKEIYLDYLIENGIAGNTSIPDRPTSQWVAESVEDNDLVRKTIVEGMKNKGWKTE